MEENEGAVAAEPGADGRSAEGRPPVHTCPGCRNHTTESVFCEFCGTLVADPRGTPAFDSYGEGQQFTLFDTEWTVVEPIIVQNHRAIWDAVDVDDNRLTIVEMSAEFYEVQRERLDDLKEKAKPENWVEPDEIEATEECVRLYYRRALKWRLSELVMKRSLKFGSYVIRRIVSAIFEQVQPAFKAKYLPLDVIPELIDVDDELERASVIIPALYLPDDPTEWLPVHVGMSPFEVVADQSVRLTVAAGIHMLAMLVYYMVARVERLRNELAASTLLPSPRLFNPSFPLGLFPVINRALRLTKGKRYKRFSRFIADVDSAMAAIEERKLSERSELQISFGYEKHIGIYKKLMNPINQDELLCAYHAGAKKGFFMICDGVSTSTFGRGDEASLIAIREGYLKWQSYTQDPDFSKPSTAEQRKKVIRDVFLESNRTICQTLNGKYGPFSEPNPETMASTGLMAVLDGTRVTIGSLGDSRAYLVTSKLIEQINFDHNLANHHLINNRLFFKHPQLISAGKALTRCIGTFMVNEEGLLSSRLTEPEFVSFNLLPGDKVLLCSDGVTDYIGQGRFDVESALFDELNGREHPNETCFELVIRANRGGGGDNISAIVIVCTGDE